MKNHCPRCNRTVQVGEKYCSACLEKTRLYWQERREKIPAGVCRKCCIRTTEAGYKQCQQCREVQAKSMALHRERYRHNNAQYQRGFNLRRRKMVIDHYGGKCECCGEEQFEFLALDHKNGGGNAHRSEVRQKGASMIGWVIANNYPDIFRVLCHNCNSAIGFYGTCPHQKKE